MWFLPPLLLTIPLGLTPGSMGLLSFVWVLIWALLSRFHPERQFWHDAWAGTRLVSSK
jgi:uncharacterized RDD family membrane protein YckC